jgi:type I restriction enzyme S subunit
MSEWTDYRLADFMDFNPATPLNKDTECKKVAMENLGINNKKVLGWESSKFNGGTKFINGDTLVARITPCLENGKIGFVDFLKEGEVGFGSTEFIVLRKKLGISTQQYIYYFAYWNEFRNLAVQLMTGTSGRQRVETDVLKQRVFRFPEIQTQQAIAEVLSSLDDKIDLLSRQNTTLEALAQAYFRQLFVEGADWDVVRLGDILETIESGSRPKGGIDPSLVNGIPSIGAESVNGLGVYDFSKTKYVSREFFSNMRRGIVKSQDVLIYKDGAYVGRKGMFGNGFPFAEFAVNEHVFILRTNEKAGQVFLYFLLQEEELAQLNSNSAQPGLNQQAMNAFEISLPPAEQIRDFEILAEPLIDKIFGNANQIGTLQKLRDTLLPKLISGEASVKQ